MGGGGEHRHVDPELGDHGLGGPLADPGDGVEAVTGLGERGDDPVDRHVEFGAGPLQLLDVVQGPPHQQGVVGAEVAASCLPQLGKLVAEATPGQLGEDLGSRSPASRARSIARPETPSTSVATEPSRMAASSKVLWMRWHSAVWGGMSRLR